MERRPQSVQNEAHEFFGADQKLKGDLEFGSAQTSLFILFS
jgi:hypothetical protein